MSMWPPWHDEPSPDLANPGFRTLFLRGVEWAATGEVTLPVQRGFGKAAAFAK